jgi:4-diphosphocytidyl-2-C-methyl-D-erythritol kinase
MEVQAPAKVNLTLRVLGKRLDGYHTLESVIQTITLSDSLTFESAAEGLFFSCSDPVLEGEDNLVMRAARLLQTHSAVPRGARIHLEKRIPQQAGLGGGSSDAATALSALNELWDLHLPLEDLTTLATDLGSDVPFFLNGPTAIVGGRGELVRPVAHNTAAYVVLAKPGAGLATADVYSRLQAMPQLPDEEFFMRSAAQVMLNALEAGDLTLIARAMVNDLERPAYTMLPDLARLRERMRALGCLGVQLCGSGSALMGVCADDETAKAAAIELENDCPWSWAGPWTMAR